MLGDNFLKLSRELTGVSTLSAQLAAQYEIRLRESLIPEAKLLDHLLEKFNNISTSNDIAQEINDKIMADPSLKKLVRLIVVLWYTSELPGTVKGNAEHWHQSILWQVIHAHVPGFSGNYFGHWSYPPDN